MNQKKAKNEGDNALLPHSEKFVNHVFQPLQLDRGLKSTLVKSYFSKLGSKEINVGKYMPYCFNHFTFIENVGLLVWQTKMQSQMLE